MGSHPLTDKAASAIRKYGMLQAGDRVLAACSGGADSTALLHLLAELKGAFQIQVFAAHVHHGLRGADADADARFVRRICDAWHIPLYLQEAQVSVLASKWGISEEAAGRQVRYAFFEALAAEHGFDKIATAHHRGDQAETILHRLIRGTGLKGLGGMAPVRDRRIIRPLLEAHRGEIEDYLAYHAISSRQDETNGDPRYTRNRIRHHLIPLIEREYNPAFTDALLRLAAGAREDEACLTQFAQEAYQRIAKPQEQGGTLSLEGFLSCHPSIQKRLVRICLQHLDALANVGSIHLSDILILAGQGQSGSSLDLPGGLQVVLEGAFLCFCRRDTGQRADNPVLEAARHLPVPGRMEWGTGVTITAELLPVGPHPRGPACVFIDQAQVKGSLKVRSRRSGDVLQPLGMNGTKKLKDLFIDRKIPQSLRDSIPLIVDGDTIVWVAGVQLSDRYKVTEHTQRVIRLTLYQQHNETDGG